MRNAFSIPASLVVGAAIGYICGYHAFIQRAFDNPRNVVVSTNIQNLTDDQRAEIALLPDKDRKLLLGYLFKEQMQQTFGGTFGIPPPDRGKSITVGEAIDEQQQASAEDEKKEQEANALRSNIAKQQALMNETAANILTAALIDKKLVKGDFSDQIDIKIGFQNKGKKDIIGIKGITIFKDIFGDVIEKVSLSEDHSIASGATYVWDGSTSYNQFDDKDIKLASTDVTKIQFEFQPQIILFKDGTKLEIPTDQ
ncbi:MAG TPA: hypothetical protein VMF50_13525 [Candidatus Binataceae bacterium]|nr:hypothetical protein [Candidatus Binataceae bacterium]